MNQLRQILKAANLTASQLSEAMGMPERTMSYQFNTGRIPYAFVYKLHLVTGIPMDDLVPKYLAEHWLYLFNEQNKTNKPRGKQRSWRSGDNENWSKNLELDEPPAGQSPDEKLGEKKKRKVSRETPTVPDSITPVVPDSITPPKQTKKSVADLMKDAPVQAPPEEEAPDFSNIPDDLFATSSDQVPNFKKRR